MKKIVIFGGGSGLSQLLKGIKLFPVEITAVVSVADNGGSTGLLRRELKIPAVGDITKVMLSMADTNQDVMDLMNYRFTKSKTLGIHSVKNLLLIALMDLKGSFANAMPVMEKILDVKGNVLPLTEDNVNLVGITSNGKKVVGEYQLTKCASKIVEVKYDKDIIVNPKVIKAVNEADLIVFSSGSLLTSVVPHLIDKGLVNIINKAKAEKVYICNLFTQPGETDDFTVKDHIDYIEKYLGKGNLDVVIANNEIISSDLAEKYATEEQKDPVILDMHELVDSDIYVIQDKLFTIEDGWYRHDALKTGYLLFSYLMDGRK
jgi:uncharacterized cofD-like protein